MVPLGHHSLRRMMAFHRAEARRSATHSRGSWDPTAAIEHVFESGGKLVAAIGWYSVVPTAVIERAGLGLRRTSFEYEAGVSAVSCLLLQRIQDDRGTAFAPVIRSCPHALDLTGVA